MNSRILRFLFLFLFLSILGLMLYFLLFLFSGYDTLIARFSIFLSEDQKQKLISSYLTPFKFYFLKIIGFFFAFLWIALGIFLYKNLTKIEQKFQTKFNLYKEFFFKAYSQVNTKQKYSLFATLFSLIGLRLLWAYFYPLTYDEIFIWEEFVQRGFAVSISYYPIHGNHVFQTLIVYFFSFLGPLWALRLPSIIFAFVLDGLVFLYLFYTTKSIKQSLLGTFLLTFFYVNWIHSFLGRGYQTALTLCFLIFILYQKKWTQRFFYELIILQVLVLFTLPSALFFLLPFWALHLYNGLWIYKNVLFTFLGSFCVYLPVLLFFNFQVLFSGAYYQPVQINQRLIFFNQIWQIPEWWNLSYGFGIFFTLFLLLILWIDYKKSNQNVSLFFSIYLIEIIVLGIFTSIPAKAFMPLSFIWIYFCSRFIIRCNFYQLILCICIFFFLLISNYIEFKTQFQKHFQAFQFARKVFQFYPKNLNLNIHLSPWDDTDLYFLNLKHVYHQNGLTVKIDESSEFMMTTSTQIRGKIVLEDENMKLIRK